MSRIVGDVVTFALAVVLVKTVHASVHKVTMMLEVYVARMELLIAAARV